MTRHYGAGAMVLRARHSIDKVRGRQVFVRAGGSAPINISDAAAAAVRWLCRAQDATGCNGFARAYSLLEGWGGPYPETTGYIIPTFLEYAHVFPGLQLGERSRRGGVWLSDVQFDSGAICRKQYHPGNSAPSVFNTGMVLHGWISLAELFDERSLHSARRAADWLLSVQDDDGKWTQFSFNGHPHAYYTMVSWALLRLSVLVQEPRYRDAAIRQLVWAIAQQQPNGWIPNCEFEMDAPALTHTLSYATQGLLESGLLTGERRFIDAAEAATRPLLDSFRQSGILAGTFGEDWKPTAWWECLTGNSQTAIVWLKLGSYRGEKDWIDAGAALNARVSSCQRVGAANPGIDGGVPGSWPIDGDYDRLNYPNHAPKFHCDALLLQDRLSAQPSFTPKNDVVRCEIEYPGSPPGAETA